MPVSPWPNGKPRPLAARFLKLLLAGLLPMLTLAPQAALAVADYRLAVGFNLERQSLSAVAEITVPAGEDLRLNLGDLAVSTILADDQPISPPRNRELTIPVQARSQRLAIHYQKSFAGAQDNLISPQGIALTGLWHPRPDRDCRFHLQASLPPGFEAVSEADQIDSERGAAGSISRFTLRQTLPGLTFVAGPYVVSKDSFGNGQTLYTYFFPEDQDLARSYRDKALAYLARYQELIGPYPYQRFSIVENRLPTGYAMAGYTLLGQSVARLPFITDTSLGHEILHAWFGNAVRVDTAQGNWCEGLTTYLADQAYAVDGGEGPRFRQDELLKYQHFAANAAPMTINDFHGAEPGQEVAVLAQRAVGYGKTAMFFHMLERTIGRQRFMSGLRHLYQSKNGRTANWTDLRLSFERGGESLEGFFDQWLNRADMPKLSADNISLAEKEGRLTLSFTLRQDSEPPYQLRVPVRIVSAAGEERHLVSTDSKEQKVTIPLQREPTALVLDPDYDLMRALAASEVPPSWDWFRGSAKRLAIVNSPSDYDRYQPLIAALEASGTKVTAANEVSHQDLAEHALIFLGISGPSPRALFATPDHPESGLTVDVRKNPLTPLLPAVLVSASSPDEVAAGLSKLGHYGKYGFLHFERGRALHKEIRPTVPGTVYDLGHEPTVVPAAAPQDFAQIVDQLALKRVVYVGEGHTRYEDHKLQLRVIRELFLRGAPLAIGMEMFPHASQPALDDFIAKRIDEAQFLKQSKYYDVWRFDYRLYREILNFAREHGLPVIALNTDRANVSKVFSQGGTADLNPEEQALLPADRDLDLPGYRERIHEAYTMHPGREEKGFAGFLQSQAIWDETMAQTIADYLRQHPEHQMVVLAGNGHVAKDNAIPPRVRRRLAVEQAVLTTSDGAPLASTEADFVVFMPPYALPPQALLGVVMGLDKEAKDRVTVHEVVGDSPAAKAGLKKGDRILTLDGQEIGSPDDVKILLLDKKVGDTLPLRVQRPQALFGDQELDLKVSL